MEWSDRALGFFLYLRCSRWTVIDPWHGFTTNCEDLLLWAPPWIQTFWSVMDGSGSALRPSGA